MATLIRNGALRAPAVPPSELEEHDSFSLGDFEAELQKLAAENQQLLAEFHTTDDDVLAELTHEGPAVAEPVQEVAAAHGSEEAARLRDENNLLHIRIEELEALAAGKGDDLWRERQREYEVLLEEKSEVIRGLHQKIHEMQESVDLGAAPVPVTNVTASTLRMGQAEEILRLKREMDEQRRQLEQDEKDMMTQMRQMEMTMAKERAEIARQRQEIQRLQAEMARDIEQAARSPELRDKLQSLRREPKADDTPRPEQKSSGFFRRIFG